MELALSIAQIIVSVLLVIAILSQNRGQGLSATFGGTGQFYAEKRGAEKVIFYITLTLAVLFVLLSLTSLFI
jgi:preprotein translocase subunit SecG